MVIVDFLLIVQFQFIITQVIAETKKHMPVRQQSTTHAQLHQACVALRCLQMFMQVAELVMVWLIWTETVNINMGV